MPNTEKFNDLYEQILARILAGEWNNQPIPQQKLLATHYGVSLTTIRAVFEHLVADGYIKQGKKMVVRKEQGSVPALVPSFDADLKSKGKIPHMENLGAPEVVELSAEYAKAFGLPVGMKSFKRVRVQGELDGKSFEPYRLTETFYPWHLAESFAEKANENPQFVLINAIREKYNLYITTSSLSFRARLPTRIEQKALKISRHTPVQDIFRTSLAQDGRTVIMFTRAVWTGYRADIEVKNAETSLK